MKVVYKVGFCSNREKTIAIQRNNPQEQITLGEFFALVENDPENRYELIEGYPCMMTGGSPDHAIIGANITGIFREGVRKRPCIVYNSDAYIQLDGEENCLCPDASVSYETGMRQK
jgi:Uma2 family endonuclease